MNTVEVSNILETSPKLYEIYIKYVCSVHMLTVEGTHTMVLRDILQFFGILFSTT